MVLTSADSFSFAAYLKASRCSLSPESRSGLAIGQCPSATESTGQLVAMPISDSSRWARDSAWGQVA